ncbi:MULTISPECIES: hypothetical protein [Gammaproteobacteria]|jgi:hypothetical protein|uniref:hypothetical protein n=3 Tax=Pseudomonadota TaxID=1224 RepID=UPI000A74F763|nr:MULTISPECIES: hypothetical protein [Gammaproteobacteria]MCZ4283943.1 hypothetical protein [Marinobacter salarius]MDC8456817.1 hypothetical protein [Marinobacter sp. DS40M6]MDC9602939.1 hypothetical protein [Pseudoalteromonas sp. GABNS16G]MDM8180225.1 hypothetical protein [Marinobacter salarius]RUT76100.1 hypothetical protein EHM94_13495 [Marinobacter sp. NP-6]|tara:strand:- start:1999 stop:3243 length:1245 start_codon:yes stop_codon:yes gene_type:complete
MGIVKKKRRTKALREILALAIGRSRRVPIFDNIQRTDSSPKKNLETDFAFYNRSSRPAMEQVRGLLECFASRYPAKELNDLASRLRSGDDVHFRSASFELFLHEALISQGFELTPHPKLPNGSSFRPDFLVKDKTGREFYLEARLASENNELDRGGEARRGAVLDTLSACPHQNFMIVITDDGSPKSPPSGKKLVKAIHNWLDRLDPDVVAQEISESGFDSLEPFTWSHDGWDLQVRPNPISPERRGMSGNLVGCSGIGGGWVDAWSPIRDAVRAKGSKYGQLEKPLVVAINLDSFDLDRIDELQALFGQEQYIVKPGSKAEPEMRRAPNGVWLGKSGPIYTRVSAVWIFNDLHASALANRSSTLYFNPWAVHCAPASLKCFPHACVEEDQIKWYEGLSMREAFQLNEGWPADA